jgi:type VI secretion system secreted protein Hcp
MIDSYLQLDGVPGEALDDKHKDWIELLGFGHEMMQPLSNTISSAGGGAAGRTQHGTFAITKYVDKASPKLYEAVSNGKHFSKAKIEVCRAGGSQLPYLVINLEQLLVASVSLNHANGQSGNGAGHQAGANGQVSSLGSAAAPGIATTHDLPSETVNLSYGKIEWVYTQQKRADGSGGGNVTGKYDLTAGKSS